MALERIPTEVLEQIAFFVATDEVLGPPAYLTSLLLTNRRINDALSSATNPHLYASIFAAKFDVGLARKRLGEAVLTPVALTKELKRRMILFKHIQEMTGSTDPSSSWDHYDQGADKIGDDVLLTSYLMMLENQGKNEGQLRHHAHISQWLRYFWFHERGRSGALRLVRNGEWPCNTPQAALAMWLFWFFLKPDEYPNNSDVMEAPVNIIKIQALGAHKYPLSEVPWASYHFAQGPVSVTPSTWYSQSLPFVPPPLAIPAILSFLTLTNRRRSLPLSPSDPTIPDLPLRDEWNTDWGRSFTLGNPSRQGGVQDCFNIGSFEGVWEGFFMYTEFTTYAVVLRGAPPQILQKGIIGRHQQTWKLREHHLIGLDTTRNGTQDRGSSLSAGDPLWSYIPTGTRLTEHRDGVVVREPGSESELHYTRAGAVNPSDRDRVIDVLITGEGHSAWGQFSLVGRVRPCDGFISLSKDYVDGDRGKWLYRGYLAGNAYGNFVGRWRDTLTSSYQTGYEGCFAMSRRR